MIVLDEEEGTTIEKVIEYFDKVQPGLFGTIMDKSILDNEKWVYTCTLKNKHTLNKQQNKNIIVCIR